MGLMDGFNEGDYIQTVDDLFFAVKGSRHPDGFVVAILRYLPDSRGDRVLDGVNYKRVYNIDYTTDYLRKNYPEYVNHIPRLGFEFQSVPVNKIGQHYEPRMRLTEIINDPQSDVERVLTDFVKNLSETSGVSTDRFGVSGSLLIGLQTESSDIDVNVYGQEEAQSVYSAMREIRETSGWLKPLAGELLESVIKSRWGDTGLSIDLFSRIESSKVLHGIIHGREYFMRLLMDDDDYVSSPVQRAKIEAKITDASRSIFNPCVYKVTQVSGDTGEIQISELKSYRGKFTEQVIEGDLVEARGTLEEVHGPDGGYHRVMLGGKGDYLLPLG
jgi:predicted nucleotidyltransferase